MSEIKVDKYDLKYSKQFAIAGVEEVGLDLELEVSQTITSSVIGNVVDNDGNPVANATVKLFDKNGVPFKHTFTDENGNYVFTGLKSENYSITVVKQGTIITVPANFFLQEKETLTKDFQINYELTLDLCSIAGHIIDADNNTPIKGALITLLDDKTKETVATTMSADDGEYVFYEVNAKKYHIVATKDGYSSSSTNISAIDHTVINTDIRISKDPIKNLGTISGIIKNNNIVLSNAFVGLYSITTEDGKDIEKLIATTKTNINGLYMFGDVVSGKYKVKSKQNA